MPAISDACTLRRDEEITAAAFARNFIVLVRCTFSSHLMTLLKTVDDCALQECDTC